MIWEFLLKTFIPVSRIFDNEDDIFTSYFPGMFENPAPAKIILKKQNPKYYEILTLYKCARRKITDDYCL